MPSAVESRAALVLLTSQAVGAAQSVFDSATGSPEARRLTLLDNVPDVIGYFAEGSAALAADFYQDERDAAGVATRFVPKLVIADRVVKIRRAIAWSAEPLFNGSDDLAPGRLAEVVQLESARPFRETITANRRQDPEAVGWKRQTSGGCRFCRMLADRGAVYRHDTARFAAHTNCHCTAVPVFGANDTGETASVMQYVASQKKRSPKQQAALREYLDSFY